MLSEIGGGEFGRRIRWCVDQVGLTDAGFARRLGITPKQVSKWMAGEVRPQGRSIAAIARVLQVDSMELRRFLETGAPIPGMMKAPAPEAPPGEGTESVPVATTRPVDGEIQSLARICARLETERNSAVEEVVAFRELLAVLPMGLWLTDSSLVLESNLGPIASEYTRQFGSLLGLTMREVLERIGADEIDGQLDIYHRAMRGESTSYDSRVGSESRFWCHTGPRRNGSRIIGTASVCIEVE